MADLSIVPNGAILIRNGVIEHVGSSRRLENLTEARKARELDATGKVVMPAFVDADVPLVAAAPARNPGGELREEPASLRLMSRKRVMARAAAMAAECARYGSLSIGAHTRSAEDLQNIGKVLRTHQALQSKPLRIRSIFSPRLPVESTAATAQLLETLTTKWLPSIRARKLSALVELAPADAGSPSSTKSGTSLVTGSTALRTIAAAAAGLGFAIRLRSSDYLNPADLQLALAAGAVGIVAPMDTLRDFVSPVSAVGCVRVIPASEGFDNSLRAAPAIRKGIEEGAAIALTSSYRPVQTSSLNMQHLLHVAVHALGLTDEEAVTATTWNAACSLRLSHVTGSIEPGRSADIIIMDVPDYRELPRRAGHHDAGVVMRAGQVIYRRAQ
jgi:imidazolonepropionase